MNEKCSYNVVSERRHRTCVLFDTIFINHTLDEVQSCIRDFSKVKKIEHQKAKNNRTVIRWNSLVDSLRDIDEELKVLN